MIRLFAHRGFIQGNILQNSIASLYEAKKNGFKAIEFDIWFLEGKLFLKHDMPCERELKTLPKFRDYFPFGNELDYWLDFKNLDEKNVDEAMKLVKKDLDEAKINLDQVYFAPFITNYEIAEKVWAKIREVFGEKVNLVAFCRELKDEESVKVLRDSVTKSKVKYLSIFHQLLYETFIKDFKDVEIFAWTVNDLERLKELEKIGVRNFATDKIIPSWIQ